MNRTPDIGKEKIDNYKKEVLKEIIHIISLIQSGMYVSKTRLMIQRISVIGKDTR